MCYHFTVKKIKCFHTRTYTHTYTHAHAHTYARARTYFSFVFEIHLFCVFLLHNSGGSRISKGDVNLLFDQFSRTLHENEDIFYRGSVPCAPLQIRHCIVKLMSCTTVLKCLKLRELRAMSLSGFFRDGNKNRGHYY